jgi:hypothetical protein
MPITNYPNGISSFGVPVLVGANAPVFGTVYAVDGTNGSDGNKGTVDFPFKTIQKAITRQIAETTGLGDVIYVKPGVYAEALTGDLTKVSLIAAGANWGNGPNAVVVYPASGYCYTGSTNGVLIENFTFVSPSTDTTNPALQFTNMRWTTLNNNAIIGSNAACIEAIQIGNRDAVATAANCDYNRIANNYIGTVFGTASSFTFGIKVGRVDYDAGASVKQCHSTIIENNHIFASTTGIYLGVYGGKANGTVIKNNVITSWEGGADEGCSTYCIGAYTASNAMVVDNYCTTAASAAAINGFQAGHVIGNQTSQDGSTKIETATS